MGRTPAVASSIVIEAISHFKDHVLYTDDDGKRKIRAATDSVWQDISKHLDGRMSKNALHIFAQQGRHGIKTILGITDVVHQDDVSDIDQFDIQSKMSTDSDFTDDSIDDTLLPCLKFVFTFSIEEWKEIQPEEVKYNINDPSRPLRSARSYYTLRKGYWTPILAEHFWIHTSLPCCISFRRASVMDNGNIYVKVIGKCKICDSNFEGIISQKPAINSRVLMECKYVGNYEKLHNKVKKRRMIGLVKNIALKNIDDGKASETFREIEGVRLMKTGDPEPAIIPSGNALRTLKWRYLCNKNRHKDVLTSLALMKTENEFKEILHDMGFDPFFLHYHSPVQIHVYRSYCKSSPCTKIIIDATGSVVKSFQKLGTNKTKTIYLYEALVYDETKKQSFTVSNMISERHTTLAIFNWLAKWISNDVPLPKEAVCDQSMALLSAIVQAFTQYSSLHQYLVVCAELTLGKLNSDSHWLPNCFVRTDIVHFMKLASKWIPLKTIPRRVREVILRCIGLIIKSQSLPEMYSIILSLFIVLSNETDGVNINTGQDTPCERHKNNLIQITSTGFIEFEQQYTNIMTNVESTDNVRDFLEEESQVDGLDNKKNPFQKWAEDIFKKSQEKIEKGCGINAMYLPSLIPLIIKCVNLLPLWSGLMIPVFKYGNPTSSSASVESSFKKLKTVTFKDTTLPTNIEIFLERHILSLQGSSLFRSACNNTTYFNPDTDNVPKIDCNNISSCLQKSQIITANTESVVSRENSEDDYILINEKNINEVLTSNNELCHKSSSNKNHTENSAEEEWNRKSVKQRKLNSYLSSNPHLSHIDLNNSRKIKSLPILKNGSRASEIKSCNTLDMGRVVISNTCAFDTIASIFMVSYCDSSRYSVEVNKMGNENKLLSFVSRIVKNGVTHATYKERTEIILNNLHPEINSVDYNVTLVSCNMTMATIIKNMCENVPTAIDYVICSNSQCGYASLLQTPISYITFHTSNNSLDGLQDFLCERLNSDYLICGRKNKNETLPCNGEKTITTTVSPINLMIEILKWEGDVNQSTEAAPQVQIRLRDIPEILKYGNLTYELWGVCSYHKGHSRLRTSIGHYTAYCKRGAKCWEQYDDLKSKSASVKENTVVSCEMIVYTI